MTHNLVYTRRACRDLAALDKTAIARLKNALEHLAQSPVQHSEKLHNPALGTYRMRTGDYRVIFDIEGNDIVILRVGHRREIYRRP
ncbi:type II toxin-antitoxin system RelE/ParE family toxin [candidate division TA06 bacterium]|uniref:Type II toxin-antitoxin system RelE/ParE family toxin n=1 Tax=candidate division TA06 bacterium TaxID=2250710 RepID=A0A933I7C0_UNCT6|nr:type II toxin-antitoxin system RelE/ParE family toxin [candidate division TA06 bacterium]